MIIFKTCLIVWGINFKDSEPRQIIYRHYQNLVPRYPIITILDQKQATSYMEPEVIINKTNSKIACSMNSSDIKELSNLNLENSVINISLPNDINLSNELSKFVESLVPHLQKFHISVISKIMFTLTSNVDMAYGIYISNDCFYFILNFYFSPETYSSEWPLPINNIPHRVFEQILKRVVNGIKAVKSASADETALTSSNTYYFLTLIEYVFQSRHDCVKIIEISKLKINVQTETKLREYVASINCTIDSIERVLIKCMADEILFLFMRGINQSILEIINVIYTYLILYQNNTSSTCPCPFYLLKLIERCFYLNSIIYPKIFTLLDSNFTNIIENYKKLFTIFCYFSSIKLIDHFSCNCMGKKFSDSHISDDHEFGNIILGSTTTMFHVARLLRYNKSGKYFIDSGDVFNCLSTMVETLLNMRINLVPSTTHLVSCILTSIYQLLLLITCHHPSINDYFSNNLPFPDEFFIFLCRSCTWQYFDLANSNVVSSPYKSFSDDLAASHSYEISENSLLILNLFRPLMTFRNDLLEKLIQNRLPSRLIILLKLSSHRLIKNSVLEIKKWLSDCGLGSLIQKYESLTDQKNITDSFLAESNLVPKLEEEVQDSQIKKIMPTLNMSNSDNSMSSSPSHESFESYSPGIMDKENDAQPNLSRVSSQKNKTPVPWLNNCETPKNTKILGAPPETNNFTFSGSIDFMQLGLKSLSLKGQKPTTESPTPRSNSFHKYSNSFDDSSFIGREKGFLKNNNQHNMTQISNSNITIDKTLISKKSVWKKLKRSKSKFDHSKNIWSYMSNMFRSKSKSNRSVM